MIRIRRRVIIFASLGFSFVLVMAWYEAKYTPNGIAPNPLSYFTRNY